MGANKKYIRDKRPTTSGGYPPSQCHLIVELGIHDIFAHEITYERVT
jgi:hypothetical protein